ncbi:DUF547 domain-containing protein [Photobacterium iliopiscarium]|uniref:DUF547 domain-containing protein n=1 Tax=Photobacterium iliopiscarium TaxID=56192 RepID=UPI001E39ACF6|nr:DUF547 domain-containing protein [Photobacterium iliopiscarium]MCD9467458.1 hypothetical protein [Photobacterium iliopiscarium]MCD9487145.1 DUF547 domain-containing protein [Photobacterium iliopiscarium]MCF2243717.1 DUF547 domain-containing protein [Photobacterium iliopiscarium]
MRIMLSLLLIFWSLNIFAAPKANLLPYWQDQVTTNQQDIDHQQWQQLLNKYLVVEPHQNLFRYSAVTPADKQKLHTYIYQLSQLDPRQYNRNVQFAYWVNLYNALTVQLILDNYPLTSITKLGGFFSFGPWDQPIVTIMKKTLSLNDIEHRILRPIWHDPRIHYAVNCASLGCPDLLPQVFDSHQLEQQLNTAASRFINSNKGVHTNSKQTTLSSIYDWYSVDFGNRQALLQHINHYRLHKKINGDNIKFDYNWLLNQKL